MACAACARVRGRVWVFRAGVFESEGQASSCVFGRVSGRGEGDFVGKPCKPVLEDGKCATTKLALSLRWCREFSLSMPCGI